MSLYSKSEKRVFLSLYSKLKKGVGFFLLVLGVLNCENRGGLVKVYLECEI